jgi:hypothetical protein
MLERNKEKVAVEMAHRKEIEEVKAKEKLNEKLRKQKRRPH